MCVTITLVLRVSHSIAALFMLETLPIILDISFILIYVRMGVDDSNKLFIYQESNHMNVVSLQENWELRLRNKARSMEAEDRILKKFRND